MVFKTKIVCLGHNPNREIKIELKLLLPYSNHEKNVPIHISSSLILIHFMHFYIHSACFFLIYNTDMA
jgi:hypothetical protein